MLSCFRFKYAITSSLLSGVIYEYKCLRCNSKYISSTYRYWEKRLEEHLHMSALTGKPLKGIQYFAPMLHAKDKCSINTSSDESIFIKHFNPSLNTKEGNAEYVLSTQ